MRSIATRREHRGKKQKAGAGVHFQTTPTHTKTAPNLQQDMSTPAARESLNRIADSWKHVPKNLSLLAQKFIFLYECKAVRGRLNRALKQRFALQRPTKDAKDLSKDNLETLRKKSVSRHVRNAFSHGNFILKREETDLLPTELTFCCEDGGSETICASSAGLEPGEILLFDRCPDSLRVTFVVRCQLDSFLDTLSEIVAEADADAGLEDDFEDDVCRAMYGCIVLYERIHWFFPTSNSVPDQLQEALSTFMNGLTNQDLDRFESGWDFLHKLRNGLAHFKITISDGSCLLTIEAGHCKIRTTQFDFAHLFHEVLVQDISKACALQVRDFEPNLCPCNLS